MSQKEENFHHIDDTDSGIFRELGEGLTPRIFPGQQAMISVVRLHQTQKGLFIRMNRNNGAILSPARLSVFRVVRR